MLVLDGPNDVKAPSLWDDPSAPEALSPEVPSLEVLSLEVPSVPGYDCEARPLPWTVLVSRSRLRGLRDCRFSDNAR